VKHLNRWLTTPIDLYGESLAYSSIAEAEGGNIRGVSGIARAGGRLSNS
jgi:hypothetical protein